MAVAGAHRRRRSRGSTRLGALAERTSGRPRWAALPGAIGGAALMLALFGFWWDVATHWAVPIGGVLLLICGATALSGFPLDDTWHRLFGQDVTLWGPTHVVMIGSASLATLAV